MITAEEFKKQMREINKTENPCPTGGCSACELNIEVSVGYATRLGEPNSTACLSILANYLTRQWEKRDKEKPAPVTVADAANIKIHMKAPQ
jgi:hypothetical protein